MWNHHVYPSIIRDSIVKGATQWLSSHSRNDMCLDQERSNSISSHSVCVIWLAMYYDWTVFNPSVKQTELTYQDGCLLWGNWVVVPEASCSMMLRELHDSPMEPLAWRGPHELWYGGQVLIRILNRLLRTVIYLISSNSTRMLNSICPRIVSAQLPVLNKIVSALD